MEIFGRITASLPERSGTTAKGKEWKTVTYVLETLEQYPKHIAFDVMNEKIGMFNIQVGDTLNVQFDIDAHEYQDKWFNSIRAWNVQRQQPGGFQTPQQGYIQQAFQGQGYVPQQPQGQWGGAQAGAQAAQAAQVVYQNNPPFPPQPAPQPAAQPSLPF